MDVTALNPPMGRRMLHPAEKGTPIVKMHLSLHDYQIRFAHLQSAHGVSDIEQHLVVVTSYLRYTTKPEVACKVYTLAFLVNCQTDRRRC